MHADLLIELLTEELPPSVQAHYRVFADAVAGELTALGLFDAATATPNAYATPRRLAVFLPAVAAHQPQQDEEVRGPRVAQCRDAQGAATPALMGFAKRLGLDLPTLEAGLYLSPDPKGEIYAFRHRKPSAPLAALLPGVVERALGKLPSSKLMRWGNGDTQFTRPLRGLVMLHGNSVVPGVVLGLTSGRTTRGHRFLCPDPLELSDAASYQDIMEHRGHVIVDPVQRRCLIEDGLRAQAGDARALMSMDLLDEVTRLVEYPAVYAGNFSEAFLSVPQECLVLSMQHHQRYFPLTDPSGMLLARFLLVSNMPTTAPQDIVRGNERVLRARLSDAKFFFDQDRKTRLAARAPKLAAVVHHGKLGTQAARVARLERLSGLIAGQRGADPVQAARAAHLCKADLLTDMVGEFPELQGVMGGYYARHDGEAEPVARAIEEHYLPRYAGDHLPEQPLALALALADKLDVLVGLFGVGLAPTADKDPFGLRRHALGVARLLMERSLHLDLGDLLREAAAGYSPGLLQDENILSLHDFILERLRPFLREQGHAGDAIEAILSQHPQHLDDVAARLEALRLFRKLPEAAALAAADKRIRNLLRQAEPRRTQAIDPRLLQDEAERDLAKQLAHMRQDVEAALLKGDFAGGLSLLAQLRAPVDQFFERVMVMVEDLALRGNRLALLCELQTLLSRVADISRLRAATH